VILLGVHGIVIAVQRVIGDDQLVRLGVVVVGRHVEEITALHVPDHDRDGLAVVVLAARDHARLAAAGGHARGSAAGAGRAAGSRAAGARRAGCTTAAAAAPAVAGGAAARSTRAGPGAARAGRTPQSALATPGGRHAAG